MLEELDRKILYSLDADSTTSLTKISQEVGISPQLVKYHLARLKKEGLILAYWPMLDFRKLGYFNVSYFLKLKNLSGEKEKELIDGTLAIFGVVVLLLGFHGLERSKNLFGVLVSALSEVASPLRGNQCDTSLLGGSLGLALCGACAPVVELGQNHNRDGASKRADCDPIRKCRAKYRMSHTSPHRKHCRPLSSSPGIAGCFPKGKVEAVPGG